MYHLASFKKLKIHIYCYNCLQVLAWATKNGNFLLPVYCFDPRHYGLTYNFSLPKTGAHRLKFLLESVHDLRKTLISKGRYVKVPY